MILKKRSYFAYTSLVDMEVSIECGNREIGTRFLWLRDNIHRKINPWQCRGDFCKKLVDFFLARLLKFLQVNVSRWNGLPDGVARSK